MHTFVSPRGSLCTLYQKSHCAQSVQECIVFNRFELALSDK